jgi:hypothetical protein
MQLAVVRVDLIGFPHRGEGFGKLPLFRKSEAHHHMSCSEIWFALQRFSAFCNGFVKVSRIEQVAQHIAVDEERERIEVMRHGESASAR